MTKLEEVARVIWHERAKHFGEDPKPFVEDERWELCLSYARAAIEALRRPTAQMVAAGENAIDDGETYFCRAKAEAAYDVMILSAILSEGEA